MKIFIAAAALCILPCAAMAADLGLRKSYLPGAETPAPAPSPWTGAYAGVNAGGGFGRVTDPTVTPLTGAIKSGGVLGGLQVGYNQQVGDFVFGLEADYALGECFPSFSFGGAGTCGITPSYRATFMTFLKVDRNAPCTDGERLGWLSMSLREKSE